jgi:hypothetical protein
VPAGEGLDGRPQPGQHGSTRRQHARHASPNDPWMDAGRSGSASDPPTPRKYSPEGVGRGCSHLAQIFKVYMKIKHIDRE